MSFSQQFDQIDNAIAGWMDKYGRFALRMSLAIIFIWFGGLKWFGISPANDLVEHTVYWISPKVFIPILAVWEVAIGVCLLFRPLIRAALFLLFLQMPGTMLPLFVLPKVCFSYIPFGLTLEGQYIIKNLVLISAALVVGGSVRRKAYPEQWV
jgi:uncharacterized membrane protein YkgB